MPLFQDEFQLEQRFHEPLEDHLVPLAVEHNMRVRQLSNCQTVRLVLCLVGLISLELHFLSLVLAKAKMIFKYMIRILIQTGLKT